MSIGLRLNTTVKSNVPQACLSTTKHDPRHFFERLLFKDMYQANLGWLGSRVVSVLDSGTEGPDSNHSSDAVG